MPLLPLRGSSVSGIIILFCCLLIDGFYNLCRVSDPPRLRTGSMLILKCISTIDLVLIDQQSVEKRNLHLMDTVNVKKRWMTNYWRVRYFLK
jgi:hypothetical protein